MPIVKISVKRAAVCHFCDSGVALFSVACMARRVLNQRRRLLAAIATKNVAASTSVDAKACANAWRTAVFDTARDRREIYNEAFENLHY